MAEYRSMYTKLFNAITDAIEALKAAQIEAEEIFMSQEDTEIVLLDKSDDE